MYDVAIIGLGPAGSTLARLLDSDLRVCALDKKQPHGTDGFHKPCGGLLAPDAQKALSRFNLTLPKDVLVDPQIFSVRTVDVKTRQVRHYQRFYMNLDRHRFDQWLRSLVPDRVDVVDDARCTGIERTEEGYRIRYSHGGREHSLTARYVVGADGAHSMVRRTLYPGHTIPTYIAVQQWFADLHASPFYSCVFDPDATDCYAWGVSKDSHFIFGGAFPLQEGRKRFEALKEKLEEHFGFQLHNPIKTEACQVLRPAGFSDFQCGGDGAFLIGEAAGFISPSSLEGLSYAFNSAWKLSQVLGNRASANPNAAYRAKTLSIRWRLVLKHLKSPFMYFPPLRKLVMSSGLNSIQVLEPGTPQTNETSAPTQKDLLP